MSEENDIQTVAVIGAGAVGAFYGAKLQAAGLKVEYQSKKAASILKTKKLKIKSIWGDFNIQANFYKTPEEMNKADLIIVSSKVLPDIDFFKLIKPVMHSKSIILMMQNGINEEEKLAQKIKKNIILGGLAFTCINRNHPNEIVHLDYGLIRIGSIEKKDLATAQKISDIFIKAGIKCEAAYPLRAIRWQKLLWNVPFNSLSVICGGADTKVLTSSDDALILVNQLMKEIQKIAKSEKVNIPDNDITTMITRTNKMKPYKTSMLLDFEQKRPMETETILGEPLRIAHEKKINVPVLSTVYHLLKTIEKNYI
ncbi:MAG: 2-dehydropantoate 2-reductase [Spirochaetia bacterium]|nr:2-dehydropantoate 2-reductase [Spirochaetia bacterium]